MELERFLVTEGPLRCGRCGMAILRGFWAWLPRYVWGPTACYCERCAPAVAAGR